MTVEARPNAKSNLSLPAAVRSYSATSESSTQVSFRPEVAAILSIARTFCSQTECRKEEYSPIDWDFFFEYVSYSGIVPLVTAHLRSCNCLEVPPSTLAKLQQSADYLARRSFLLAGELFKLQNALDGAGVPFVCFKGLTLAEPIYGDLTLRQFADLDILVGKALVSRVHKILLQQGYAPTVSRLGPFPDLPMYTWVTNTQDFVRGEIHLDLHWALTSTDVLPLAAHDLVENVSSCQVLGRKLPCLTPELQLIILCTHGFQSYWSRLTYVVDISRFASVHKDLDWKKLLSIATRSRILPLLQLAFSLADDLLSMNIPEEARARLFEKVDADLVSLATEIKGRFNYASNIESSDDVAVHKLRYHLAIRGRLSDRILLALRGIFIPTLNDWWALPLPSYLFWCYFPFRPCRLLFEAVTRRIKRWQAAPDAPTHNH